MPAWLALWGLTGIVLMICLPAPKTKWGARFSAFALGPLIWLFLPLGYLRVRYKMKKRREAEKVERPPDSENY